MVLKFETSKSNIFRDETNNAFYNRDNGARFLQQQ